MGLSIDVYRNFPLDDSIADFWRRNQWHPHGDIDHLRYDYENRKDDYKLNLIAVRDQSDVIACSIGKIQKLPLKLQLGYRVFNGPLLTTLVAFNSGFIGAWEHSLCELLLQRWQEFMVSGLIDVVWLRGIPLDSPLHTIASVSVPLLRRGHFETVQEYWLLTQLDSFESFLKNHRHLSKTFRKHGNRIDRVFGKKVTIECYRSLDEMEAMLKDSEEVGKKTWQRKLGAPSFLDGEERWKYRFYFERGWCRSYILYLDQVPVAFQHGNTYKGVFYAVSTGYDPSYRNLGVGAFLLMNVIRDLCGETGIHAVDFNVGNSEDKKQYCDSSFQVSDIHLFGPGLKLWAPIFLRLAAQSSHELAKRIAHHLHFYQTLRKRLR